MAADHAHELEAWLRSSPSAHLNQNLHFIHDEQNGLHWQASRSIEAKTTLITIPHSHCLSYLNALVDDRYPVFKAKRDQFTVEAIGFFYLMLQYINRDTSFWRPYLNSLPSPKSVQLTTPLWFDTTEDDAWLQDTDVAETMAKRKLIYEQYYESGCQLLSDAGIDTSEFSWLVVLSKQARVASSDMGSKYWAAFKNGPNDTRQTVLLDMSHIASADLDFSVLFPGIDVGNHDPSSPALWSFDPGRFSIAINQQLHAGQQIFNNYGPKANHELLQGYGFSIENNPNDCVLLTLKAPSQPLQQALRLTHAGYFSSDGVWLPDKATFGLKLVEPGTDDHRGVFDSLPDALLEMLVHVVREGHGLNHDVANYSQVDLESVRWQRCLPHICRILTASLVSKYTRLSCSTPNTETTNRKQIFAKYYRDGQLHILKSYMSGLSRYMASLEWHNSLDKQCPVRLARLEDILGLLEMHAPQHHTHFLAGINANAQSSDINALMEAGWEEDILVLLLCYLDLLNENGIASGPSGIWLATLVAEYKSTASEHDEHNAAPVEQIDSLSEMIQTAAQAVPDSLWTNTHWRTDLIARIYCNESFVLGGTESEASSAPRVAVLWFDA